MLSKLLLGAALVLAVPASALAQHWGHEHEHWEHRERGPEFRFGAPGVGVEIGPSGIHGRFLGEGRHWYRGRWWGYGEGECWERGPYGRWYWICD